MFMTAPWEEDYVTESSIEVKRDGALRYTITRNLSTMLWELRRAGESEVVMEDQYRHDLLSGIQSGRIQ